MQEICVDEAEYSRVRHGFDLCAIASAEEDQTSHGATACGIESLYVNQGTRSAIPEPFVLADTGGDRK